MINYQRGKWIIYKPSPYSFAVMIGDPVYVNFIHLLPFKQYKSCQSKIIISLT